MTYWTRVTEFESVLPNGAVNLEYHKDDVVLELMLWPPGSFGRNSPVYLELATRRGRDDPRGTIKMRNYFHLRVLLDKMGVPEPDTELKRKWFRMANSGSSVELKDLGKTLVDSFEEQGAVYKQIPGFIEAYRELVGDPLIGFSPEERNKIKFLRYLRNQRKI